MYYDIYKTRLIVLYIYNLLFLLEIKCMYISVSYILQLYRYHVYVTYSNDNRVISKGNNCNVIIITFNNTYFIAHLLPRITYCWIILLYIYNLLILLEIN